ncbi:hypothetical protein [Mucilaginibacter antarcticus]|uniref:DUF2007 domain-containing protein n=1 Tax=Mucilaginibacter antarcticus TaxID=1855725 RepID=A0ABW5XUM2_9SPHI
MNILITSALSARAHQVKARLTANNILLGDYNDVPAFMLTQGKMIKLPSPQSSSFAHQMLTLCLDNAIEVLYLLDVAEAEALNESEQLFLEYNIEINTDEI